MEVKDELKASEIIRFSGKIATPRWARKAHKCDECGLLIEKDTHYYEVVFAGSGLGSLKFPDRIHPHCIDSYLKGDTNGRGNERT